MTRDVYIVDGARSPYLKAKGRPGPFSASDLATHVGRSLFNRLALSPEAVDQVILGCVSPSADETNIARIVALRLGCGHDVPAWTVQRNCASRLKSDRPTWVARSDAENGPGRPFAFK